MVDDERPVYCWSQPGIDSGLHPVAREKARCTLLRSDEHDVCSWGELVYWKRPLASYSAESQPPPTS